MLLRSSLFSVSLSFSSDSFSSEINGCYIRRCIFLTFLDVLSKVLIIYSNCYNLLCSIYIFFSLFFYCKILIMINVIGLCYPYKFLCCFLYFLEMSRFIMTHFTFCCSFMCLSGVQPSTL